MVFNILYYHFTRYVTIYIYIEIDFLYIIINYRRNKPTFVSRIIISSITFAFMPKSLAYLPSMNVITVQLNFKLSFSK